MKEWSPRSEVELAQFVVQWLETNDWEVYQEVRVDDVRADIVALTPATETPRKAWIIECKRNLTLDVIAQAWRWRRLAKWVSVAIPDGPKFWNDGRKLAYEILEWKGIGCLPVGECGVRSEEIKYAAPNIGSDSFDIVALCRPEHKTSAPAGSKGGGYHTQFKEMVTRLEAFVRENPGMPIKHIAKQFDHHYGGPDPAVTFRVNVTKLLKQGKIKSIRGEDKRGLLCLFPVQEEGPVVESRPDEP